MRELSDRELLLPDVEFPKIFQRVVQDKSIISLGPGEPDFQTPQPLLNYAAKMLPKATHYSEPRGMKDLREAIVKKLWKENKIRAEPDQVAVGCGSQEMLFASLLTTFDPTDRIVIPSPGYLGYLPAIELVNAVPDFLKLDEEDAFSVNPDRLRKLINKKRTKAILINSPSNPTGTVLSKKLLEEIADIAVDTNTYIFSDEAYEQLTFDKKAVSIGSLNGMQDYTVTFQSFSKTYAMCGFRVGYCVGPKKFMEDLVKVHHYITLTAPHLSQIVATKALTLPKSHIQKMVKEYKRRRNYIVKRLNDMGFATPMPQGAFYTFSNMQHFGNNSLKFARSLMDKAKVAVIPGSEFGPHGEGYFRCSYATDYNKIVKAMDNMEKVVSLNKK